MDENNLRKTSYATEHIKWYYYNISLVRRGEILLGFDVINNWDTQLKEMNKDKIGLGAIPLSKYFSSFACICQSNFIFLIDKPKKVLHKDMLKEVPSIPDYTTINRRINRLISR